MTVTNLAKSYGFLWALKDIDLELPPGSFVALLGPNGAGKTTFLKLLAGLTAPTMGKIEFDGIAINDSDRGWRANVGFLAPADHLYENLTVEENLRFFCGLYQRSASGISGVLEAIDLAPRAAERVINLSSGMKCRLSIAKWQLLKSQLLLLDEPYGVLDGKGVDLLERFLQAHIAAGGQVVMASHHVARALKICNRAVILHHGSLTFDEPKREPWPSFVEAFREFLPQGDTWSS